MPGVERSASTAIAIDVPIEPSDSRAMAIRYSGIPEPSEQHDADRLDRQAGNERCLARYPVGHLAADDRADEPAQPAEPGGEPDHSWREAERLVADHGRQRLDHRPDGEEHDERHREQDAADRP